MADYSHFYEPQQNYAHFYEPENVAPIQSANDSVINNLPGIPGAAMRAAPGIMEGITNPMQALSNRLQGVKRGGLDIAQGLAQAVNSFKEQLGYAPPGSTNNYTQQKDLEREQYAGTPAGRDPFAEILRGGVSNSPYAAMGPIAGGDAALISKMLQGAATSGGINALQYVPQGGSRKENALHGAEMGALFAGAPELAQSGGEFMRGLQNKAINSVRAIKDIAKLPFNNVTQKEVAGTIQNAHDQLKNEASNLFGHVENEAYKRGINKVPIDRSLIDSAYHYLPQTRAAGKLINNAQTGDYSALRKLQSELWQRATAKKSSELPSEWDTGDEMMDLRDQINEGISNHFREKGHNDLADTLDQARKKYHELKETYYSHPTISKLVDESTRKVPANLGNVVNEDSKQMERMRNANPMIKASIEKLNSKSNALKGLKSLGKAGLVIGGAAELNHLLGGAKMVLPPEE